MDSLLEQNDKTSKHRGKKPPVSDGSNKSSKHRSKKPSSDNSQTTTKPQVQPTDDGIPKPASGGDIKIQLIYTKTNLPIQNQNFVSAIQKALNKGNDYSSNNIFK